MKMGDVHLDRRTFLSSSAAVVSGLLLPRDAFGMASRPGLKARVASRARLASTPITGATVNPTVYHMTNWVQAANTFDGYVGHPLATTIQKFYMVEGQFPSGRLPLRITEMAKVGCQFIICAYPSRTTDQTSQLAAYLQLLNSNGIVYQLALVNEWNCRGKFATPQAYLDYWSQYAPVVKAAGASLACLPLATSNRAQFALIEPGFPTDPLPDAYWLDFYATGYSSKVRLDVAGGLLDQAESYGVPVGIAEFGWSATGVSPGMDEWDAYCSYVASLVSRLPLGCLYWGSAGLDVVTNAQDRKIPGIRQVISAFP